MPQQIDACTDGDRLKGFFAGLSRAVEHAKYTQEKLDRLAATQFSVFDYFHERETDLSRIFAKLLDPRGTHGQGDRFLRSFLEEISLAKVPDMPDSLPSLDIRGTKVCTEYPINDGRIDIVLHTPNNVWIGIENKPWAKDGANQVKKYLEFFRQKKIREGDRMWWILLYLSGDGHPPPPTSLPDDTPDGQRCVTVPYRKASHEAPSIENWAHKCWGECEAERVRWFLRNLLEYIQASFRLSVHYPGENHGE